MDLNPSFNQSLERISFSHNTSNSVLMDMFLHCFYITSPFQRGCFHLSIMTCIGTEKDIILVVFFGVSIKLHCDCFSQLVSRGVSFPKQNPYLTHVIWEHRGDSKPAPLQKVGTLIEAIKAIVADQSSRFLLSLDHFLSTGQNSSICFLAPWKEETNISSSDRFLLQPTGVKKILEQMEGLVAPQTIRELRVLGVDMASWAKASGRP